MKSYKYKGCYSDTSRTVFVGGITDEEKKVYDIILRANKAGEKTAKQGVKVEDVYKASRDISKSKGYGHFFLIEQVMVSVLVFMKPPI